MASYDHVCTRPALTCLKFVSFNKKMASNMGKLSGASTLCLFHTLDAKVLLVQDHTG